MEKHVNVMLSNGYCNKLVSNNMFVYYNLRRVDLAALHYYKVLFSRYDRIQEFNSSYDGIQECPLNQSDLVGVKMVLS